MSTGENPFGPPGSDEYKWVIDVGQGLQPPHAPEAKQGAAAASDNELTGELDPSVIAEGELITEQRKEVSLEMIEQARDEVDRMVKHYEATYKINVRTDRMVRVLNSERYKEKFWTPTKQLETYTIVAETLKNLEQDYLNDCPQEDRKLLEGQTLEYTTGMASGPTSTGISNGFAIGFRSYPDEVVSRVKNYFIDIIKLKRAWPGLSKK